MSCEKNIFARSLLETRSTLFTWPDLFCGLRLFKTSTALSVPLQLILEALIKESFLQLAALISYYHYGFFRQRFT